MRKSFTSSRRLGLVSTDMPALSLVANGGGGGSVAPVDLTTAPEDLGGSSSVLALPSSASADPVTETTPGALAYVQGIIYDAKTGSPLSGVTVTVLDATGTPISTPFTLSGNTYNVWTPTPDSSAVLFHKSGYTDRVLYFNDLTYNPEVDLTPGGMSFSPWLLLLAVPLLMTKKKKRSVTGISVGEGILIGGLILVSGPLFKLLNQLLNFGSSASEGLGLSDSTDRQLEDSAYSNESYPLFSSSYAALEANAPASVLWQGTPDYSAQVEALQLARGFITEDSAGAISLFKSFSSQFEVSEFANQFYEATGTDLFTYMRKSDTLFAQGFSSQTVATIIRYINNLPVY